MKRIKAVFKWLWGHFGWGYHGHSVDTLFKQRINPDRLSLSAYCRKYGLTRKAAKKGFRRAKMWRKNWADVRRAEYDRWKAGR